MKFKEIVIRRRSERRFEPRKVEKEKIERILETVFTAPSSRNTRSTHIAVTDKPEILEIVSQMRDYGSAFVKEAPLAFFIMGDEAATDLWRENCAISATLLQLAAEDEGLASCWVHVHGRLHEHENPAGPLAEEWLRERLPQLRHYGVLCVVACGYPEQRHKPHELSIDPERVMYL